ncbi:MAG: NAD-dependent epimerase/dehydratase family protein [Dehalococcoidia bacterium]|nr:NAD-dependent epimerase/dehydratase family protein [Dehalococcoidia bacterium]
MRVLVTGGTGSIGSVLVRSFLERGDEVLTFGPTSYPGRVADIAKDITIIRGNLAYQSEVFNAVKNHRIDRIFHLGSMLSLPSNANPWAAFQVNVVGTMNVLEAARLFDVPQFIFTSTIGTYAHGAGEVVTDETLQRPATMYGTGKLYGENLGRFYRTRFGLDFRSVRLPSIMSPCAKVRVVAQYNSWMIEYPILGKPFPCFVTPETKRPCMYFKDAVRAISTIADAPADSIAMVNYNVGGLNPTPSAKDIELEIRKHFPGADVTYEPDPVVMKFYETAKTVTFDDTCAREEWGWMPQYETLDVVVPDFIREVTKNPSQYGLA